MEKWEYWVSISPLHMNHMGPLEKSHRRYRHIFEVVDDFIKFVFLVLTRTRNDEDVIKFQTNLFKIFVAPRHIITDLRSNFTGEAFTTFCDS